MKTPFFYNEVKCGDCGKMFFVHVDKHNKYCSECSTPEKCSKRARERRKRKQVKNAI